MLGRLGDVARAGLALRADHRRALVDAAKRLAEVGRTADERGVEGPLVDVVHVVGRREHLGLVDVVDVERLQHLRLDEVADAGLRHDGDRHLGDDRLDEVGVAHAGDAALCADVGGNALERHDGDGAGVFGDARLLGGDDVHDDAALEHLGEAALDAVRAGLRGRGGRGDGSFGHGVNPNRREDRARRRDGGRRAVHWTSRPADAVGSVQAGQARAISCRTSPSRRGSAFVPAMIGKKFESSAQRGTMC